MKIGIVSDIHGNIDALEKVLIELDKKQIEKIICLGDIISGAGRSEETVQKFIQIKDKCIFVRGNKEKYLIEGMPDIVHDEKIKTSQKEHDRNKWIKEQLSESSIEFINSLPKEKIIEIENKKIYMCHYPMNEDGSFKTHNRRATLSDNIEMFSNIDADIYLYGHTHKSIHNFNENKHFINPGSLGFPQDTNKAYYGILEIKNDKVTYEQLDVSYDVDKVIQNIRKLAFPGYENIINYYFK